MATDPNDVLASMAGQKMQGGCSRCDAYQTVSEVRPGVWSLKVAHDSWCPFLRAHIGQSSN
jgi:hypothetical protein